MLNPPTASEIETIVHARIHAILEDRGDAPIAIEGADKLSDTLGLASLDLALLVAELVAVLGFRCVRHAPAARPASRARTNCAISPTRSDAIPRDAIRAQSR